MLKWIVITVSYLYLFGCMMNASMSSPELRTKKVEDFAKSHGWQTYTIPAKPFILKAYGSNAREKQDILTIYLEGDGLAWLSDTIPSDNPTPINPIAFKMALNDKKSHIVVYLARPCQFVFNKNWKGCRQEYWTSLRFSFEVIQAMNKAIDFLKQYYQTKKIILIGYSGGGTIAALLAARRSDVEKLITVAAVLDLKKWINQGGLTPLQGSLDPADEWQNLIFVPQAHWVGGKDKVVPKEIAFAYSDHFPSNKKPTIIVEPTFDHTCCWATDWKAS